MCGVVGVVDLHRRSGAEDLEAATRRMADTLQHRGPDDSGMWLDAAAGVALGHRRLAIIDLSPGGHQPMLSPSGRYVISYNGEIYNFRALRADLEGMGHRFRGDSDTEVLLAALEQWGLEAALEKLVGMFAFALWDRERRVLHLARDRLGKKPLYFGRAAGHLVFASELKALRAHPQFSPEVDREALTLFLRHKYVPAPHSIYRGIHKLRPGSLLSLPLDGRPLPHDLLDMVRPYWSLQAIAEAGAAAPLSLSEDEAIERLDHLLQGAVAERMIADVPLGAFLSGGIDSSIVVALMQAQAARPIKTFTIGFHEGPHNEAADAAAVASRLGTEHAQLYLTPTESREVIPRLAEIYDEPFADESQIPTFLVAQFARHDVTVALSGDGGDESFGGYTRHFLAPRLWRGIRFWPSATRHAAAWALTSVSTQSWDAGLERLKPLLPRSRHLPMLGEHAHRLAALLLVDDPAALYRRLLSHWTEPAEVVIAGAEPAPPFGSSPRLNDLVHWMMYCDTLTYLPDDILVKVDRASMAVSLEARAPLLDHRVLEFAWRLPLHMKIRDGRGKWLLRQVLARYLPPALFHRPKQGFTVPVGDWLRGPLRDWAEDLLGARRLEAEGFLRAAPVRAAWQEHLSGRHTRSSELWAVLMFQAWRERWL